MEGLERVQVGVGLLAAALEVLATNQTSVHILVAEGDRADFLKIEVEQVPLDCRDVGAERALLLLDRRLREEARDIEGRSTLAQKRGGLLVIHFI